MNKIFLMVSESVHNANMYYATNFLSNDKFIYIKSDTETLIVSDMELGRAKKESKIKNIIPISKFNIKKYKDPFVIYSKIIIEFLNGIKNITVPYDFPIYLADCLRNEGLKVVPIKNPFISSRETKNISEISYIEKSQRASQKAVSIALEIIKNSYIKNGVLWYKDSKLRTEDIVSKMEIWLTSNGYEAPDIILGSGKASSDPHFKGEGEIFADQPIVIDIVTRSKKERYFSDMTRTIVRGNPSQELKDMYDAVYESQISALNKVKQGVTCSEIHETVCDILEERGYKTVRNGAKTEGFIHSTGHGIGLDIHESPSVSDNEYVLKSGNVITIEPGLYYKNIGGVRLEDMVLVTKNGCKNLTIFEKNFVVS